MILHAGDLTELAVLEAFAGKNILAVCGNMDSQAARKQFPTQRVFQAGKFTIGLVHGWGGPQGIEGRIAREFQNLDCIVYATRIPPRKGRWMNPFFQPGASMDEEGGVQGVWAFWPWGKRFPAKSSACESQRRGNG